MNVANSVALDLLQLVVLGKIEQKSIGHGFAIVESAIDKNDFFAVVMHGADIARILHFFLIIHDRKKTA